MIAPWNDGQLSPQDWLCVLQYCPSSELVHLPRRFALCKLWMRAAVDGCQLPAMVNLRRKMWSKEPGTTDPLAPFGIVTLASAGSECGSDIGGMRKSQMRALQTLVFEIVVVAVRMRTRRYVDVTRD